MGVTAAGIAAAGAVAGGTLSFMGAQSAAKSTRDAMKAYIENLNNQRSTFLNNPESSEIRKKLGTYINGDVGYSPDVVNSMRSGVTEDYGKSLADMTRLSGKSGAASTGVYTPGRSERTTRLLGQNIASNRATSMRDITKQNADVALNNQRLAISALPTYMDGLPATQVPSPDVYQGANAQANIGTYLGPAVASGASQYANMSIYGPIMEKMMASQSNPANGMNAMTLSGNYNMMNPSGGYNPNYERLFPTK